MTEQSQFDNEMGRQPEAAPQSGRWLMLRVGILSALVLFMSLVGMRVLLSMRKAPKRKAQTVSQVRVQTQVVKKQAMRLTLKGYGTTQAKRVVELIPEVAGKVVYISPLLREGARVKKGALLLRLDSRSYAIEYKRLKRQIASLRKQSKLLASALRLNRRNVNRNRRLLRRKVIDQGSYDTQSIQFIDRQQRLESLKQNIGNLEEQLRLAALKLQHTRIRAPFDARITSALAEKGGYVSMGKPVAKLESRYELELPVSFPLASLQGIRNDKGEPIDLEQLPAYLATLPAVTIRQSESKVVWKGRVVRVGAKLDLSTRTVPLWVHISLRQRKRSSRGFVTQPTLLPGTFCQVAIPTRKRREVVVVPRQALYGNIAYLAVDNRIARRRVDVIETSGDKVLLSKGLKPGERLIISPLVAPRVGAPITIQ